MSYHEYAPCSCYASSYEKKTTVKKICDPVTVKGDVGVSGAVSVTGCVGINNTVCTLSEKRLIARGPLTAMSTDCTQSSDVAICLHPNVVHGYDFECSLADSCDSVDGSAVGSGGIFYGDASDGVQKKDASGNSVLGKYLSLTPNLDGSGNAIQEVKISLNGLNVDARGFTIATWFRIASDEVARETCLVSKTDDRDSLSNEVQNHIWSLCLTDTRQIRARVKLGNDATTGTVEFLSTSVAALNCWYHVVLTYDGCEFKLYLNGVEETLIAQTDGSGNDAGVAFLDFKGQSVFQGSQAAAIGSQATASLDENFRLFKGCLDQLVFFDYAIKLSLVQALYNGGSGTVTIPHVSPASQGSFDVVIGKANFLTNFKQVVCVSTCFKDPLCKILSDNVISLKIGSVVLFNEISLSSWPGDLEVLSTTVEDCVTTYSIRLSLDFEKLYGCAYPIADGVVKLSIGLDSNLEFPLSEFVLSGFSRDPQGVCSVCTV